MLGGRRRDPSGELQAIREKFSHFLAVLEYNNQSLKIISDMEEKAGGEFLFDINYVRSALADIRLSVRSLIEAMIALGGDRYYPLRIHYAEIDNDIALILPGGRPIEADRLTVSYDELTGDRAPSVGGKNAQLGEMKSVLGLPVPEGFAISGWAYKRLLDANNLHRQIEERIDSVDIRDYAGLVRVSQDVRNIIRNAAIPSDLRDAIKAEVDKLTEQTGTTRFCMRSSAIGEDSQYSFAGQYASYLNVRRDGIVDGYREVLGGKFTPQAIYYFLSHSLNESELAMSVGCLTMVDARAAGVIYTRDPIRPNDDSLLINSVYGLGKYLVDGTLTPDLFRINRSDGSLIESDIATKHIRLVLDKGSGTVNDVVPADEQNLPSISDEEIRQLTQYAMKIEQHYNCPQDIEWAIDHEGHVFILQTRQLRMIHQQPLLEEIDLTGYELLMTGTSSVCPGAGGGPVHHVRSTRDLGSVPDGAVLVAPHSFPGLVTVMSRARAIVTETGGIANHMATIAREYRLPALGGVAKAAELPQGEMITVDATEGNIYAGMQAGLIAARQPDFDLFCDLGIFDVLRKVLREISPLNLIRPTRDGFVMDDIRTFHDIVRYCHQKAMDEMFKGGLNISSSARISIPLKTKLPLQVNLIHVDQDPHRYAGHKSVSEDEIDSVPMTHFWRGVLQEGWPGGPSAPGQSGLVRAVRVSASRRRRPDFSQTSFAILSREYMILNLRLGYHFTTVEAMCTDDVNKNYIRMQHKQGGAQRERRERRVKLLMNILSRMGFEHQGVGDFLDSRVVYRRSEVMYDILHKLGRLTILTKQLDMALSSDSIAEWYTMDIARKIGLGRGEAADT